MLLVDALAHHNERSLKLCLSMSMVAQVRQPSGWPVSSSAGTANLVWATTHGISSSGGSFHHKLL
ncbi:ash family protein [Sodalis ligni]|uniref:ash family protein n=1 Tax=Sodalis sp. RH16 TaxID=3394331 RepID=UPI00193F14CE|nr:ash family protein [Sodalis ligni]